jgi:acetyl-CoA carboxylase biotin carboxyl carrier protein
MELELIKALVELLKDTDITELQIEKEGMKVRLRRERPFGPLQVQAPGGEPAAEEAQSPEEAQRLLTVTAPLVGTFYRAPSPDAEPFVQEGDRVKKGQVLCIIEAMKLMNEIESEVEGTVVKVLVENGQPVEYGEPLFLIEPAS